MLIAWHLIRECDLDHTCEEIFPVALRLNGRNIFSEVENDRNACGARLCIFTRSRLGQFTQRSDIQHNDRAVFEANPAPGGPGP